jgi:hypothetical protein
MLIENKKKELTIMLYKKMFQVYANGWVEALAQEIRSTLRLGLFQRQGHPQLQVFSCDAHVVDVQVRIGGGFLPWLVDLFHDSLSKAVKDEINSQVILSGTYDLKLQ